MGKETWDILCVYHLDVCWKFTQSNLLEFVCSVCWMWESVEACVCVVLFYPFLYSFHSLAQTTIFTVHTTQRACTNTFSFSVSVSFWWPFSLTLSFVWIFWMDVYEMVPTLEWKMNKKKYIPIVSLTSKCVCVFLRWCEEMKENNQLMKALIIFTEWDKKCGCACEWMCTRGRMIQNFSIVYAWFFLFTFSSTLQWTTQNKKNPQQLQQLNADG